MTNVSAGGGTMGAMASKGKPSPRSAVKPLSDEQVAKLARKHHLVDPTHDFPTGPRKANTAEIEAQNPKATHRLLAGCDVVLRNHSKVKAWGLEHVPETGPFITPATHATLYDVFVPMVSLFHQGRRPRYMAKAEMAKWPLIGKWFQLVGMQPVQRRAGKAKAIEDAEKAEADQARREAEEAAAEQARKADPFQALAEKYAKAYPDCKAFHITSDRQVFLDKDKNLAQYHQKGLGEGEVRTINVR